MGSIYKRGGVFWIKYYRDGAPIRESTHTGKEKVASKILKAREGDVAHGLPVNPKMNRATFDELAADVVTDYVVNGKSSLKDVERRIKLHLKPHFTGWRAANITTDMVRAYIAKRQAEKASNATINRELSALKRAFSLGLEAGKLTHKPKIPGLRENNVRKGFFEREQFEAVRSHLRTPTLRRLATVAYITGWRVPSEVQTLQWRQVDLQAGTLRLEPGTTKNREGRLFHFTAELRAVLEAQRAETDAEQRKHGIIIPHVFHHLRGKPIKVFRRSWATACRKAGCPGMLKHDFRRTAVRNLVRAGVPEVVAMRMTGHKTRSVFDRYNIVSDADLQQAAARLDAAAKELPGTIRAQSDPSGTPLDNSAAASY